MVEEAGVSKMQDISSNGKNYNLGILRYAIKHCEMCLIDLFPEKM